MKRIRIIVIILAVIVIGVVVIASLRAREPRYEGRTLSEWIEKRHDGNGDAVEWKAAENAIREIGTNSFPLLLEWVAAHDSRPKTALIDWLKGHKSIPLQIRSADEYHDMADGVFLELGVESKPAWPGLIKLTSAENSETRECALLCLVSARAGKDVILPVLRRLVHDQNRKTRFTALNVFVALYPDNAKAEEVEMPHDVISAPTNRSTIKSAWE